MNIGVPTEIKNNECRVALTPNSVKSLTDNNYNLFVQSGAGESIGFSDESYTKSGAIILEVQRRFMQTQNLL